MVEERGCKTVGLLNKFGENAQNISFQPTASLMLSSPSGDFNSSADYSVVHDNVISVPKEGGSYTITCKNYSPWIDVATINGVDYRPSGYMAYGGSMHHLEADWVEVKIEDKEVHITVSPVSAIQRDHINVRRTATMSVTAGDIFDSFAIKQEVK